MNNFKELTLFLDKYSVKYTIQSDCVEVEGNLGLENNNLKSLPESFGNLKIGGGLWLGENNLTSLPESFGNLKIRGSLYLEQNNLTSLPESFGNLMITKEKQLDLETYNSQFLKMSLFQITVIALNLHLRQQKQIR